MHSRTIMSPVTVVHRKSVVYEPSVSSKSGKGTFQRNSAMCSSSSSFCANANCMALYVLQVPECLLNVSFSQRSAWFFSFLIISSLYWERGGNEVGMESPFLFLISRFYDLSSRFCLIWHLKSPFLIPIIWKREHTILPTNAAHSALVQTGISRATPGTPTFF